jgi:signal transduction histidine kinase
MHRLEEDNNMSKARLFNKLTKMHEQIVRLKASEKVYKHTKEILQKKTHALGERVKELNCLYAMSNLVEKHWLSLEKILSEIVDIIPSAWQYPEITRAKIMLGEQIFATDNFKETPWKQSSPVIVEGKKTGSLEVFYLEEKPRCDEGPFLKEERSLINGIAKRIGEIIERRRLEKQVLEISEWEQQRIGQDLHDGLSQQLAGIAFLGKVLQQKMAIKSLSEAQDAGEIISLIDEAITQTKGLASGLCPVRLEANGLMTALSELSHNVERLFGVLCRFEYDTPVLIDDNIMAIHLYRIAQEAVNNAIKHGKATHVVIHIRNNNRTTILTVRNNGLGFRKVPKEDKGLGISIMKYRADMIGASLDIKSYGDRGTIVSCSFQNRQKKKRKGKK